MERIVTVNLPDIGEGVVEGEVIQWLKRVGDELKQDEPVVVVMTDKATVELPAPEPGRLKEQFWKEGELAIKGRPLYSIATSEGLLEVAPQREEEKKFSAPLPLPASSAPCPSSKGKRPLAGPATRHMAKLLGVSLEAVGATGERGEVTLEDLKGALQPVRSSKAPRREGDQLLPLRGVPWLMAEAMAKSHAEIPAFTYVVSYDPGALRAMKRRLPGVTFMPFFIKAWALVAKEIPLLNASIDMEAKEILLRPSVDMGIAVDAKEGLLLPVLHAVDRLSFSEVVKAFDILKEGARGGTLPPDAMRGATLSLSNFGTLGGLIGTPIIPPSQVAILGIGKMEEVPLIREGRIEAGWRQYLSFSCDHRVVDGATVAKAADRLVSLLLQPELWV